MLIYFLMAVLGVQLINQLSYKEIHLKTIIQYLIPYWHDGDWEDRILGIVQLFIIGCMSGMRALKAQTILEGCLVFGLTFLTLVWLIRLLLCLMEWFQEYIHTMTLNLCFTLAVPCMILGNLSRMKAGIEAQIGLVALMMSLLMVYMELISIVLGKGSYKQAARYLVQNSAMKLKSILTWLIVIIINLYTLLIFIQFYVEAKAHPFIEAEALTKSSAVDLFYYLIVTFTTVGFGDISPHTVTAKLVSSLVALSGMLFTGIFVGCILNLKE